MSSAREQTAKNVTNAVQKHAAKASSKRDVSVDHSSDTKTESGEETGVVRELQNINVGRTLNFVFRQMNQEYVSLLHLVDVGIAFSNGMPGADRIVPLWKLDSLLQDVIADAPAHGAGAGPDALRVQIKNAILRELRYVRDYQDHYQQLYELFNPTAPDVSSTAASPPVVAIDSYARPSRTLQYTYTHPGTGMSFTVPGVLLAVTSNVMCTDGVIVDTILGQSEALDDYSINVRNAAAQAETAANDLLAGDLTIEQLRQRVVAGKHTAQAAAFAIMFPPQPPQ
jgi:hypothetical protein